MKRKIYIKEKQLPRVGNIITENWAKRKRAITNKTLFILGELFPNASSEELSAMEKTVMRMFFRASAASDPKLRPLEPLIAKILYGEVGYRNKFMYDKYKLFKLRQLYRNLKTIANNKIKLEFSINDTLKSLIEKYGDKLEDLEKFGIDTTKREVISGNEEYEAKEIEDFEMASEYGQYTCPGGELCYTDSEETWNEENYSNNGVNTCYVFLRNGWEDEKPIDGENSPYDDYGLSMIWVFISPEGNIVTSNSRWNHHNSDKLPMNRDVDFSFDEADISEITGYDINDLDRENSSTPEILEKTEEFKKFINNGGDIRDAFYNGLVDDVSKYYDIFIATIGYSSTFVKDGKFLYPNLWVDIMKNGDFLKLFCDRFVNVMFPDGSLLANNSVWFKDVRYVAEKEVFITKSNNGFNIYDLDKMPLLSKNVENISNFYMNYKVDYDFFHICSKDKKWYLYSLDKRDFITYDPSLKKIETINNSNWLKFADVNGLFDLIDLNGRRMYGEGKLEWVGNEFMGDLLEVRVGRTREYNLINSKGQLMLDSNMNVGYTFSNFANLGVLCEIDKKYCVVTENGIRSLTDTINSLMAKDPNVIWSMGDIVSYKNYDGFGIISVLYSYNSIKNVMIDNTIISDDWFENIKPINNNGFICYKSYKYNILKLNGELLLDTWAKEIKPWKGNYFIAIYNAKNRWNNDIERYALINTNTMEIDHNDIDELKPLSKENDPTPVSFNGYANFIKPDGKLLNSIKYSSVGYFNDYGWAEVTLRNRENSEIGYNVVFKDGSNLSNELYKEIIGGNDEIIAVRKFDNNVFIISIPSRKENQYTYNMFQYLYKSGLGEGFAVTSKDDNTDLFSVGIKKEPTNKYNSYRQECVGYNFFDPQTNEFVLPKFYRLVDTKDGRIFIVYDGKNEDVIDRNGNSLIGGRKPIYVDYQYSSIGTYRIDFNDNGSKYIEFYDDDFNLLQRMTEEEYDKWVLNCSHIF